MYENISYDHHSGRPFFLEIYFASNVCYCLVLALTNFLNRGGSQSSLLFCYIPNIPLSRTKFAALLKHVYLLTKIDIDKILYHSCRIGMASHCADIGMGDI